MYSPYDINAFIGKIKGKDYPDIILEFQREVYNAERGTSGVKGAVKKREAGG